MAKTLMPRYRKSYDSSLSSSSSSSSSPLFSSSSATENDELPSWRKRARARARARTARLAAWSSSGRSSSAARGVGSGSGVAQVQKQEEETRSRSRSRDVALQPAMRVMLLGERERERERETEGGSKIAASAAQCGRKCRIRCKCPVRSRGAQLGIFASVRRITMTMARARTRSPAPPSTPTPARSRSRSPAALDGTPNVLVTDFSLLEAAPQRYASSPLALPPSASPYHNIADTRFLWRFSFPQQGTPTPTPAPAPARARAHSSFRGVAVVVADAQRFAENGGQRSVVVLADRRIVQRRVARTGCPSGNCLCLGRGLAMAGCGDLPEEDEDDGVAGVGQVLALAPAPAAGMVTGVEAGAHGDNARIQVRWGGKVGDRRGRLPVTDRIEDARAMRARLEQRRAAREAEAKARAMLEQVPQSADAKEPHRGEVKATTTVKRRRSRFVEVGCTLGDDSVETLVSSSEGSNVRDSMPTANSAAGPSNDEHPRDGNSSTSTEPRKVSWMRKLFGF